MKNKSDDFSHDMIGYNFRMPNINALWDVHKLKN